MQLTYAINCSDPSYVNHNLYLDSLCGIFHTDFVTKILCAFLIYANVKNGLSLSPLTHNFNYMWRTVQIMKLFIVLHSASACNFCLTSKYSPQRNVSKSTHETCLMCQVKAKAFQLHATEALGGRGSIAPTHSHLGARWGWVVSVTPRPSFNPGERIPCTHCTAGWAPEPVWTQRLQEKSFRLCRDGTSIARSSSP
jgi:hypothetical protein